ncbi:MAG: NUDIX domain-containing protein [Rhodobacteraceae bacterium]|nr:NUDIX domain-containing protein [Paracoccaceae bacterium]
MQSWRTLSRRSLFQAAPYVSVSVETVELPDNRVVEDFYQVDLAPCALIVPVMADGRILMLRQYKHGPRRVSLTFPAGFVEDQEPGLCAAKRELLEETGCRAAEWVSMGSYVDNGNQRGCQGHFFLAKGCQRVQPPASGDLEEMVEELWTAENLDAAVRKGEFAITHQVAAWGLARLYL